MQLTPEEWLSRDVYLGAFYVEWPDGSRYWFLNGKFHKEDGPAVIKSIINIDDCEEWYFHGFPHRIGGPAISSPDSICWYEEGELHRVDGPAIIDVAGRKSYYLYGKFYSKEDFLSELSLEQMALYLSNPDNF